MPSEKYALKTKPQSLAESNFPGKFLLTAISEKHSKQVFSTSLSALDKQKCSPKNGQVR